MEQFWHLLDGKENFIFLREQNNMNWNSFELFYYYVFAAKQQITLGQVATELHRDKLPFQASDKTQKYNYT